MAAKMSVLATRQARFLSRVSFLSRRTSMLQLGRCSSTLNNRYILTRSAKCGYFNPMKRVGESICTASMISRSVSSTCALRKADSGFKYPEKERSVTSGNILIVTDVGEIGDGDITSYIKSNMDGVVEVVDFPDMNAMGEEGKIYYIALDRPSSVTNAWKKGILKCLPVRLVRVVAEAVSKKITKQDLHSHFLQYGAVHNVMQTVGPTTFNSWVIDFVEEAGVSAATANKTHLINGIKFSAEKDTRFKNNMRRKQTDNYDCQMKVSDLPIHAGVDDIRAAFEKYGDIMAVDLDVKGNTAAKLSAWVTFNNPTEIDKAIFRDKVYISGEPVTVSRAHYVGMMKSSKENELLIENLPVETYLSRVQGYFKQFGDYYMCKKISENSHVIMFKNHRNMKYFGGDGILNFYGTEIRVRRMGWRASSMGNIATTKTLLLGNLPAEVEVDSAVEVLETLGSLKSVNMVLFDKGYRRPRAFVEYYNLTKTVGEMLSTFKGAFGNIYLRAVSPIVGVNDRSNRLVIVDYPDNVSKEMLHDYLSQFGSMKSLTPRKEQDAERKVYYVTFDESAAVEKMRKHGKHLMKDQELGIYYLHWSPNLDLKQEAGGA